jgi:hypothetical protein
MGNVSAEECESAKLKLSIRLQEGIQEPIPILREALRQSLKGWRSQAEPGNEILGSY